MYGRHKAGRGLILLGRTHEFHVTDLQCRREFVKAHDRRVSPTLLEAANVLLAEPGNLASCSCVRPFSCLIRFTFRPTSLRMSMRPRSADNDLVIYQL